MEIAPLINNAVVSAVAASASAVVVSASASSSSFAYESSESNSSSSSNSSNRNNNNNGKENDNVNNLALLASLTLRKVLNINNINNNNNNSISQQQQQNHHHQLQQQQRRHSDNEAENDVLNQLLRTGAIFTKTTTKTSSAPIAIEKKRQQSQQLNHNHNHHHHQQQQQQQQQHGQSYQQQLQQQQQQYPNSAQKQRLNSSISSTNSSLSYGSSISSSDTSDGQQINLSTTPAAATTTNTIKASSIKLPEKSKIPSDILDDLASRFIINVPDMELNNLIRICFQIELAHWFYLDFFCAPEPEQDAAAAIAAATAAAAAAGGNSEQDIQQRKRKLPEVGIKQFAMQLFQHIPFLNKHFGTVDQILEEWKNYKLSVPTYGAILIAEDLNHCLLVQSYFARNSWGFPKGKINENEDPAHCATREVYEETGFDITDIIDANDYIEAFINYQYTRLYIVRNIPIDTQFAPRTRNEIKCCEWFRIDALPVNKNDAISKAKLGKNANSFFMIIPFVKRLKKWVNERKAGIEPTRRRKFSGQQSPKATSSSPIQQHHQQEQNQSGKKDVNGGRSSSRRQRHKSMGDLDGMAKMNNLNGGGKTAGGGAAGGGGGVVPTSVCGSVPATSLNICNSNNGKRNKQNAAAGSNITTTTTTTTPLTAGGVGGGVGNPTSKRQLFHSQSQNDAQQPANNEKIVSSFDAIRKGKQQQQKASKAQKQQQQQQQQQRSRAKSQSDKQSNHQQQQQPQQQPQVKQILGGQQPTTGMDLIAMLTAAAAAKTEQQQQQQQPQQRPRPASVSLNFGGGGGTGGGATTPIVGEGQSFHKLQRMASGTNLKRAQSQQQNRQQLPQQQQHQLLQQQQQQQQQQNQQVGVDTPTLGPLNFTPNFNSWTNFSFTKNFIANVFC